MSSNIIRVYPIRTTKKEWCIPLFCYHECTPRCSRKYVLDYSHPDHTRYVLVNNPDYINDRCSHYKQLEKTFIRLSLFSLENPMGGTGPLYEPEMVVIPDLKFSLRLFYPLSYPVSVEIESKTGKGFTLKEVLYTIKTLYTHIYEMEEKTSTHREYIITHQCTFCVENTVEKNTKIPENLADGSECSICYKKYESKEDALQLCCNHIYHSQCILRWLETATTCPLCRRHVTGCEECEWKGIIYHSYWGAAIPLEYRGSILNRNTTDGIFGIYGHDLDDLVIENMHYSRIEKRLYVHIGS